MKITPNHRISTGKVSSKKAGKHDGFGNILAAEQTRHQSIPSAQQHTQPEHDTPQEDAPLDMFEQASDLLQRALSQLELNEAPSQETIQSIQNIHQELDTLLAKHGQSRSLIQAKTILHVEAKRIQQLKS